MFQWTFAPDFWTSKTTQTAIVAVATTAVAFFTHHVSGPQALAAIFAALQTAFLRDAHVKAAL